MKNKVILLFIFFLLNCLNGYSQDWWGHSIADSRYHRTFKGCIDRYYKFNTVSIDPIGVYVNLKTQETFVKFEMYKVGGDNCLLLPVVQTLYDNIPNTYIECNGIKLPYANIVNGQGVNDNGPQYIAQDYQKVELNVQFKGVLPLNPTTFDIHLNSQIVYGGIKDILFNGMA